MVFSSFLVEGYVAEILCQRRVARGSTISTFIHHHHPLNMPSWSLHHAGLISWETVAGEVLGLIFLTKTKPVFVEASAQFNQIMEASARNPQKDTQKGKLEVNLMNYMKKDTNNKWLPFEWFQIDFNRKAGKMPFVQVHSRNNLFNGVIQLKKDRWEKCGCFMFEVKTFWISAKMDAIWSSHMFQMGMACQQLVDPKNWKMSGWRYQHLASLKPSDWTSDLGKLQANNLVWAPAAVDEYIFQIGWNILKPPTIPLKSKDD